MLGSSGVTNGIFQLVFEAERGECFFLSRQHVVLEMYGLRKWNRPDARFSIAMIDILADRFAWCLGCSLEVEHVVDPRRRGFIYHFKSQPKKENTDRPARIEIRQEAIQEHIRRARAKIVETSAVPTHINPHGVEAVAWMLHALFGREFTSELKDEYVRWDPPPPPTKYTLPPRKI